MPSGFQPSLLRMLPPGVWHLKGMVARREQEQMREPVREIARAAPLVTPLMPGGTPPELKTTNAGGYAWTAYAGRLSYERRQASGAPWARIPTLIAGVAHRAARAAGCAAFEPTDCLVNFYGSERGSLGLYRDDTTGEDFTFPVVTIFLGDSAVFGVGGASRQDGVTNVEPASGDVLVMGGAERVYDHRVSRVMAGTSDLLPKGGRSAVTLRRVGVVSGGRP